MKKILSILSILFILFAFIAPIQVSAATSAGIKPGSFFYFFDTTFENISLFFTFGSENKAKKALEYADERLAEAKESADENNPKAVEKAMVGYKEEILFATKESKGLKNSNKAELLLNTISENTIKHQGVLTDILKKVPKETKQMILNAIKISKKGQEEAIKEIAELKGKIKKLKKEVAKSRLKAKNKILTKETEETKKQKPENVSIPAKLQLPPSVSLNKTSNKTSAVILSNSQIIKKVKPVVVYIETDAGTGSGMIISSDGFILTNAHVVSGVSNAKIKLSDERLFIGSVIGRDEKIDLAILKIKGANFPTVILGDSSANILKQGDEVFSFGYPFGLKGDVSFKEGTISRRQTYEGITYLETSAEVHPGNSGGPLVNRFAQVVGVNTQAVGSGVGGVLVGGSIKFALPINLVRGLIPKLKAGRNIIVPKTTPSLLPSTEQEKDLNLKIAKCKAVKQSFYDKSILKIDQATKNRLKEIFNSLNQQYKDATNKVFADADVQISRINNNSLLSATSKLSLIKQYNDDSIAKTEQLYQNQQIFWNNQKTEVKNNKQNAINKINQLLSEKYSKCLNQ